MPRIRTVKPDFLKHWDLFRVEQITNQPIRLSFLGLWLCSDKEGRFKWQVQQLKLDVLPYNDVDFEEILNLLVEFDFVKKYEYSNKFYGYVPTLKDHQRFTGSEAYNDSRLPEPVTFLEVPRKYQGNTLEELWQFHLKKKHINSNSIPYINGTSKEIPDKFQGNNLETQERKGKERKGTDDIGNRFSEMTKTDFDNFHEKILSDTIFTEPLFMTRGINGNESLIRWLYNYDTHIAGESKLQKDYSEYKRHFKNWINLQDTFKSAPIVQANNYTRNKL